MTVVVFWKKRIAIKEIMEYTFPIFFYLNKQNGDLFAQAREAK